MPDPNDTPKKPYGPAIGYPIPGKHPAPTFPPKRPPRTDGGGMTQSIDPRTEAGKKWLRDQKP